MRVIVNLLIISALISVMISCNKDDNELVDSGKLELGQRVEVLKSTVPSQGSTITVPNLGSPIDQLSIIVKENSYTQAKEFVIAYFPIKSHAFGPDFKPVSPLIEVNNGGEFSNEVMYLSLDIIKGDNEQLAPFYYDRATGKLESIPIIGYSAGKLTIAVRHFSLIVVSAFEKELFSLGGFYETYFDPATNGWSFANEGSWSSVGNCAGMSIGASYYYQDRKSSILLKDHFDNSGYWFQTPTVEVDDADGIKFASSLQKLFSNKWKGAYSEIFESNFTGSDEDNFWSMVYAIHINKDPQLIFVGNAVNTTVCHMVVATAYEFIGDEVHFKIYDPNYPNKLNTMKYNLTSKAFLPYISAENTQAILENRYYEFRRIVHIPLSTVVSKKEVDDLFAKTADHTIASDIFPQYEVYAIPTGAFENDFKKVKLIDAQKGLVNTLPFNTFIIGTLGLGQDQNTFFNENSHYLNPQTKIWEIKSTGEDLELVQAEDNLLGVHIYSDRFSNRKAWTGFHYYKLEFQNIWIEADQEVVRANENIEFQLRSNGKIPAGARIDWDFGNGEKTTVYNDTTINYRYPSNGNFIVKAVVFDVQNNKEFGKANINISVQESKFDRINVLLIGKSAGEKPFLFDDGHSEGTISFTNVPSSFNHPKLKWAGNIFNATYTYGDTIHHYDIEFNGTFSSDFKTLLNLSAAYTEETEDIIYESSVILKNLPVTEFDFDNLIIDVKGIATKSHIQYVYSSYTDKLPDGSLVKRFSLSDVDHSKTRIYINFLNDE